MPFLNQSTIFDLEMANDSDFIYYSSSFLFVSVSLILIFCSSGLELTISFSGLAGSIIKGLDFAGVFSAAGKLSPP